MKISEQWLREWVSPDLDSAAIVQRLTMAGLEVDGTAPAAPSLDKVVVGEILSLEPHPDADRLRVCQVDIGRAKPATIVCGAPNATQGIKAPVALPGAALPAGTRIEKTTLRGVASDGMLCSARELGLDDDADGLLVLDRDATPGRTLVDALALDDIIIEIDLTPNRGDCLSVAGIARELSALTGARLRTPAIPTVRAASRRTVPVALEARRLCPRYVGRVIVGIDAQASTPLWMKERLRRGGIRSIGAVVDVTNYVLLELGQPMHAFDLDRLDTGIRVVQAAGGERLELLDGSQPAIAAGTLLIADHSAPLAVAGVMGGQASAVSAATHTILLESAYFTPEAVAGRARSLGVQSESAHRFERGVDPALQRLAMERATGLLLDIVGGRPGPVIEKSDARFLPRRASVRMRHAQLERLLGAKLPASRVTTILKRLGMKVQTTAKGWRVQAPSYRFDIEREVDLIEEVARVYGYDHIPARLPAVPLRPVDVSERRLAEWRLRALLVDRDYQEVITYSFVDPGLQAQIDPEVQPAVLANPLSADMAAMRTTLWPGLLQAILYNQNRQLARVRLFELGRRFVPDGAGIAQDRMLAGAICGSALAEQWGVDHTRGVDFFDAKADVEAVMALARQDHDCRFEPASHPALHPGQTAEIRLGGRRAGWLGRLHPELQTRLSLEQPVYLFEIEYDRLQGGRLPEFREISRFPAIRRDVAVVVKDAVAAQQVLDVIAKVAGKLLINLELFDEYRGEGIDSGRKSLALGLTLQDSSRTLKENEVEAVVTRVLAALQSELGGRLRE